MPAPPALSRRPAWASRWAWPARSPTTTSWRRCKALMNDAGAAARHAQRRACRLWTAGRGAHRRRSGRGAERRKSAAQSRAIIAVACAKTSAQSPRDFGHHALAGRREAAHRSGPTRSSWCRTAASRCVTPAPAPSQDTAVGALTSTSSADSMAQVRSSSFFWSSAGGTKILRPLICFQRRDFSGRGVILAQTRCRAGRAGNAPQASSGAYCTARWPPDFAAAPADADDGRAAQPGESFRASAFVSAASGIRKACGLRKWLQIGRADSAAGCPSGSRHWRRPPLSASHNRRSATPFDGLDRGRLHRGVGKGAGEQRRPAAARIPGSRCRLRLRRAPPDRGSGWRT